jgi:hypothetical protein
MDEVKTVEQLQEELNAALEASAKKDELIDNLSAKVETISVKAEVKAGAIISDVVEIAGKKYQFKTSRFGLPGFTECMNAADVLNDEEVLAAIVAIDGQGILQEIF